MGKAMAKLVLEKDDLKLVAAVSKTHTGKDFKEVIGKKKIVVPIYIHNEIFNKVKEDLPFLRDLVGKIR